MERVAFQHPAQGQPAPPQSAVDLNGLQGVGRAGGDEAAAGGTQRGNILAVEADEGEEDGFHELDLSIQQLFIIPLSINYPGYRDQLFSLIYPIKHDIIVDSDPSIFPL